MVQRVNDADESRDPFYEIVGETWPRESRDDSRVDDTSTARRIGIVTLEDVLEELIGARGGGGAALAESTHFHGRCSQAPRSSTRATCTPTT